MGIRMVEMDTKKKELSKRPKKKSPKGEKKQELSRRANTGEPPGLIEPKPTRR
jgi:hypothetical protein